MIDFYNNYWFQQGKIVASYIENHIVNKLAQTVLHHCPITQCSCLSDVAPIGFPFFRMDKHSNILFMVKPISLILNLIVDVTNMVRDWLRQNFG